MDKKRYRKKVDDLIELALDERNGSDSERLNAATQAFRIIREQALLDGSVVDQLVDPETSEFIEDSEKFLRGAKRMFDKVRGFTTPRDDGRSRRR